MSLPNHKQVVNSLHFHVTSGGVKRKHPPSPHLGFRRIRPSWVRPREKKNPWFLTELISVRPSSGGTWDTSLTACLWHPLICPNCLPLRQSLFRVLDEDGSGDIAYQEFVEQVVKMRRSSRFDRRSSSEPRHASLLRRGDLRFGRTKVLRNVR